MSGLNSVAGYVEKRTGSHYVSGTRISLRLVESRWRKPTLFFGRRSSGLEPRPATREFERGRFLAISALSEI